MSAAKDGLEPPSSYTGGSFDPPGPILKWGPKWAGPHTRRCTHDKSVRIICLVQGMRKNSLGVFCRAIVLFMSFTHFLTNDLWVFYDMLFVLRATVNLIFFPECWDLEARGLVEALIEDETAAMNTNKNNTSNRTKHPMWKSEISTSGQPHLVHSAWWWANQIDLIKS